jgi:hypothetical protein
MGPGELLVLFGLFALLMGSALNQIWLAPLYISMFIFAMSPLLVLVLGVIAIWYWWFAVVSAKQTKYDEWGFEIPPDESNLT